MGAVSTRLPVRAALAALAVAGAVLCGLTYVSQVRYRRAFTTLGKTADWDRALGEARASESALNPSAARDGAIAFALIGAGRPAEAERVAAAAARREPKNAAAWEQLTRIQVTRGRLAGARASWARARRLNPHASAALPAPLLLRPTGPSQK